MKRIFEKFENSQLEKDINITGGASNICSHKQEATYVGVGGDIKHTCDTTLSDEVVIGYSFPK